MPTVLEETTGQETVKESEISLLGSPARKRGIPNANLKDLCLLNKDTEKNGRAVLHETDLISYAQ